MRWLWLVVWTLVLVACAALLALDPVATRLIRARLANLETMTGSVSYADVSLVRPGVVLRDLSLDRRTRGGGSVALLRAPRVEIRAGWRSIWRKPIEVTVRLDRPELTQVAGARPLEGGDWRETLRAQVPFVVRRLTAEKARVTWVQKSGERIALDDVRAEVRGLSNLPGRSADFAIEAPFPAGGSLAALGATVPLKPGPLRATLDVRAELLPLRALSPLAPPAARPLLANSGGTMSLRGDLTLGARLRGTVTTELRGFGFAGAAPEIPEGLPGEIARRAKELREKLAARENAQDVMAVVSVDLPATGRPLDRVMEEVARQALLAALRKAGVPPVG